MASLQARKKVYFEGQGRATIYRRPQVFEKAALFFQKPWRQTFNFD
jgi:hypothetical protein